MADGKVKIATCQFAVAGSVGRNAGRVAEFMREAKRHGADVVHFSECALSGYAGWEFDSFEGYDWQLLKSETEKIITLAGELGIWVVLGSTHRLTEPNKPHNCLYLIGPDGKIADRYDKRFCMAEELEFYTPGDRFVVFDINKIKCALLICFDLRFPELYRELKRKHVQCIFQSFYSARRACPHVHTDIMRQTMQCRAATNYFWVSMTNSSAYYSPFPSCFIWPDGKIAGQLKFNRPGLMINTVDLNEQHYDPSARFRQRAMRGILNSGDGVSDRRSKNKTNL